MIDIGIPRGAPGASDIGLIRDDVLDALPGRAAASTKFSSGHVVVVGGSRGLMGAPAMASLAALRAGAGYVTACVPASLQQILDVQLLEVMTRGLADEDGALTPEGLSAVKDSLGRAGCLALGPGLGRDPQSVRFARELAREASLALVLDADGLNAHAGSLAGLAAERGADGAYAACRRACATAGHRQRAGTERAARTRAQGRRAGRGDRRAQGRRHAGRRARRPRRDQPRQQSRACHSRHRRRAHRHDRGAARAGDGAICRSRRAASSCMRRQAARRPAGRERPRA